MAMIYPAALRDIQALEQPVDHIVIEASGVALPGSIASGLTLMQEFQLHGTVVLANSETLQRQAADRYIGDTICRQLESADLLILNKSDLLNKQQQTSLTSLGARAVASDPTSDDQSSINTHIADSRADYRHLTRFRQRPARLS